MEDECEKLFHKLYNFPSCSEPCVHIKPECIFQGHHWEIPKLVKLRDKLNETKCLLSDMDIKLWRQHTQFTNKAGAVQNLVKRTIHPELCTQAWCKFCEILVTFNLVETIAKRESSGEEATLFSVHLCEAPGAFVTSLNHRLRSTDESKACDFKWLANTLNPYYEGNNLGEMITDDRLIIKTLDNWYFGEDNTGNLMHKCNLLELKKRLEGEHIHLVTADGSIDCADNPAEQEILVAGLHYCELTVALSVLSPGGSLVLKMFTLFEDTSICLMYLLHSLFYHVSVFKPVTSKPGNSEVYVVARSYKGVCPHVLETMIKYYDNAQSTVMFQVDQIPTSFLDYHYQCCQQFTNYQVDTINNNIQLFNTMDDTIKMWLEAMKDMVATRFIQRFQLQSISDCQKVVPQGKKYKVRKVDTFQTYPTGSRHQGSFNQRMHQKHLSWQDKLDLMTTYEIEDPRILQWFKCKYSLSKEVISDWNPTFGQPLLDICCSKLCEQTLIEHYNELQSHITEMDLNLRCSPPQQQPSHYFKQLLVHIQQLDKQVEVKNMNQESQEGPFGSYLINQNDLHITAADEQQSCSTLHYNEDIPLLLEQTLLQQANSCIYNLKYIESMAIGDHFVFVSRFLLTRVHAAMIYLLSGCFQKISIFPSEQDGYSVGYIVGYRLQNTSSHLAHYINQIHSTVTENKEIQLLEIIPTLHFHDMFSSSGCMQYMCSVNDLWMKLRMDKMILDAKASS